MGALRTDMNAKIRTMHAFGKFSANVCRAFEQRWVDWMQEGEFI